jgi:uncharacterized membrane protein
MNCLAARPESYHSRQLEIAAGERLAGLLLRVPLSRRSREWLDSLGGSMQQVSKSLTIRRPRNTVYQFWRNLENLPRFMYHLEAVQVTGDRRSHWAVKAPAGQRVEWDAEIVQDTPDELIAWRSLPEADIRHEGAVRFRDAPADRGTEVDVELRYEAPGGSAGSLVAMLFGEEPKQQLRDDLRRFKQVMETGEVVLSDGSLEGAGQGPMKQRASQAPETEERR